MPKRVDDGTGREPLFATERRDACDHLRRQTRKRLGFAGLGINEIDADGLGHGVAA